VVIPLTDPFSALPDPDLYARNNHSPQESNKLKLSASTN
jgi:hypothetical protein